MQLLLGIEGVYLPTFLPDGGKTTQVWSQSSKALLGGDHICLPELRQQISEKTAFNNTSFRTC